MTVLLIAAFTAGTVGAIRTFDVATSPMCRELGCSLIHQQSYYNPGGAGTHYTYFLRKYPSGAREAQVKSNFINNVTDYSDFPMIQVSRNKQGQVVSFVVGAGHVNGEERVPDGTRYRALKLALTAFLTPAEIASFKKGGADQLVALCASMNPMKYFEEFSLNGAGITLHCGFDRGRAMINVYRN